ncbi:Uncharacterized protein TCM_034680 [Theobroma cacao]|uniref:Uncharacterized protein n=1 Tax=Theobroma cacao TaxID=3641 RepID=A0A061FFP2_THECC|nr:Uncharacterized protein TCM_034680 [Theobroma cacao]
MEKVPLSSYKLNIYGSAFGKPGLTGIEGAIRDDEGFVIFASWRIKNIYNNIEVLKVDIKLVTFTYISREANHLADGFAKAGVIRQGNLLIRKQVEATWSMGKQLIKRILKKRRWKAGFQNAGVPRQIPRIWRTLKNSLFDVCIYMRVAKERGHVTSAWLIKIIKLSTTVHICITFR